MTTSELQGCVNTVTIYLLTFALTAPPPGLGEANGLVCLHHSQRSPVSSGLSLSGCVTGPA